MTCIFSNGGTEERAEAAVEEMERHGLAPAAPPRPALPTEGLPLSRLVYDRR